MEGHKIEQSVSFQFGMFMRAFRKLVVKRFQQHSAELTLEQFGILFKISEEQEFTQTEIANSIGIDKSAVLRMIDVLEAKEYIARAASKDDRRKKILLLTARGAALIKDAEKFFDGMVTEISAGVKEDELKVFMQVLEKLRLNAEATAA